jgi:hypothetical protein
VTDVLKLARHVEAAPVMIVQMVGYRIEAIAMDAAAPYLPGLRSALPPSASRVLDALPPGPTLQQMAVLEKRLGPTWLIRALKDAERREPGSWRVVWDRVFEAILRASERDEAPTRNAVRSVKTFGQAIEMLEGLATFYDEFAEMAALPPAAFDARYPAFVARATAANPLASLNLPNKDTFIPAQRRAQVRMALFRAALTVVQGGPARLGDIKDPFGDGPFEYRALDRGFELESKLLHQGKPVTLTVGQRAAQ